MHVMIRHSIERFVSESDRLESLGLLQSFGPS
jgi:hypothetical protein